MGTDRRTLNLIVFSISFASFMVNLDTYIVTISLPSIGAFFGKSTGEISWVALAYNLAVASLLIIFGKLGDRVGLRKIFMAGLFIFTSSSLLCGLSPSLYWLIGGRLLQGLGASILYAMTPAMVPRYLPVEMRGAAFGTLATAAGLGIIIGTPLGGLITGYLSWQWIFYLNVLPGLAALILCHRIIPGDECAPAGKGGHFDFPGSILSFTLSLALIYGLNMGQEMGWRSWAITGSFALAALSLGGFIAWEKKCSSPLMELGLFRSLAFSCGNMSSFLASNVLSGHNFLMPFYLILVMKLPAQQAGLVYLIYSAVYMITGPLAGRRSNAGNSAGLSGISMALAGLSTLVFSFMLETRSFVVIILYFVILGVSYGIFITANNIVVVGMAPEGKQGIVSGIFRMIGRLGMASGVCIFETVFSAGFPAATGGGGYMSLPGDLLLRGFHTAYLAGGAVLLCAALVSIIPGFQKRKNEVIP